MGGDVMAQVRAMSAQVEARTGYQAFLFSSHPTPTSARYVFSHGPAMLSEAEALARMAEIVAQVASGAWDHWNCRSGCCPWSFGTEAERDAHEVSEPRCQALMAAKNR